MDLDVHGKWHAEATPHVLETTRERPLQPVSLCG